MVICCFFYDTRPSTENEMHYFYLQTRIANAEYQRPEYLPE